MPREARSARPSDSVTKGGALGTALGTIIDVAATLAGHPLPPGSGAALGGALAMLCAYFAPGGRKGDAR